MKLGSDWPPITQAQSLSAKLLPAQLHAEQVQLLAQGDGEAPGQHSNLVTGGAWCSVEHSCLGHIHLHGPPGKSAPSA